MIKKKSEKRRKMGQKCLWDKINDVRKKEKCGKSGGKSGKKEVKGGKLMKIKKKLLGKKYVNDCGIKRKKKTN